MSSQEYIVLSGKDKHELEKQVNEHMKQSYVPSGNVYCEGGDTCSIYHQAMVKKSGLNRERLEELREKKRQRDKAKEDDESEKSKLEIRQRLGEKIATAWREKHEGSVKMNNADNKLVELIKYRNEALREAEIENSRFYSKEGLGSHQSSMNYLRIALKSRYASDKFHLMRDEKQLDVNYGCMKTVPPYARLSINHEDQRPWWSAVPADEITKDTFIYAGQGASTFKGYKYSKYSPNNNIAIIMRELDERDIDVIKAGDEAFKKQTSTVQRIEKQIRENRMLEGEVKAMLDVVDIILKAREEAREAKLKGGRRKKHKKTKRKRRSKKGTRKYV